MRCNLYVLVDEIGNVFVFTQLTRNCRANNIFTYIIHSITTEIMRISMCVCVQSPLSSTIDEHVARYDAFCFVHYFKI